MENTNNPTPVTPEHNAEQSAEKQSSTGKEQYNKAFKRGYAMAANGSTEEIEVALMKYSTGRSYDIGIRKGMYAFWQNEKKQEQRKNELSEARDRGTTKEKGKEL